jgi:transposase
LESAYRNLFRRCTSKAAKKGFPRFKSRKNGVGSFTLTGAIRVSEKALQLPRLGVLRLKERGYLPRDAHSGRWFVSIHRPRRLQSFHGSIIECGAFGKTPSIRALTR